MDTSPSFPSKLLAYTPLHSLSPISSSIHCLHSTKTNPVTCVGKHSVVSDSFTTPWTVAHQAPLSTGFPRQEYWSELPFPTPGDFPDLGIEPTSSVSPALQEDSLLLSHRKGQSCWSYHWHFKCQTQWIHFSHSFDFLLYLTVTYTQ